MPVHLPNYDTYNTLSPAQLPRITTNVSDAEAAENTREVKATMDLIALTKTNLNDLIDAYKKQLDALKQKLQQQVAALTSGASSATTMIGDLNKLAADLTQLGNQQNNAALKKAGTDVAALATAVQALNTTLVSLQQAITTATANFSKVTQDATTPDVVLRNILGLATTGIGAVTKDAHAAATQLKDIDAKLTTVVDDAKNLTGTAQANTQAIAAQVKSELIDILAAPLNQLIGPDLVQFIEEIRKTADTAAPLLNLNAPEILTVSDIVETRLEIPRADPADGDVLDFATQVFQNDKQIYEEHRSVTVHFYGWHSGLASGLIFVRADKTAQSNFKPEAAAIWRIQMTPRPDDTNVFDKLRPAIGFHTTTLHFATTTSTTTTSGATTTTTDNNNVQFGAGITFHLFGDVLQTGYGWNLGVTKDRGYMYVGIGIMQLLRTRLGQPATQ
jgi:hypothetical protein